MGVINFDAPFSNQNTQNLLWINSDPLCMWSEIMCKDGVISSLDLTSMNLHGIISSTIGLVTSLHSLYLGGNLLRGSIPSEIGI
mmetsp:Transcript_9954/g.29481  ORF Transcript_9954/g.29481 Transcript_9954/m.29481 type:complete len:84 (+) Transcript_9954:139-390(+)